MTIQDIAGPPPTTQPEFFDWLVAFWEYHAGLQTDEAEHNRCEDMAWQYARAANAYRRDKARAFAQQEAA